MLSYSSACHWEAKFDPYDAWQEKKDRQEKARFKKQQDKEKKQQQQQQQQHQQQDKEKQQQQQQVQSVGIDIHRDSTIIQGIGAGAQVTNSVSDDDEFENVQNSDEEVIREMDCAVTTRGGNIASISSDNINDKFSLFSCVCNSHSF